MRHLPQNPRQSLSTPRLAPLSAHSDVALWRRMKKNHLRSKAGRLHPVPNGNSDDGYIVQGRPHRLLHPANGVLRRQHRLLEFSSFRTSFNGDSKAPVIRDQTSTKFVLNGSVLDKASHGGHAGCPATTRSWALRRCLFANPATVGTHGPWAYFSGTRYDAFEACNPRWAHDG